MSANVKFTGEASDLLAKQKQVADGAAKVTDQYKATSEEMTRLRKVAKQVWEETTPALEKHAKRMEDLNRLLKEGKITQEQFARATEIAADKLDKAGQKQSTLSSSVVGMVASYATIDFAMSSILSSYDAWIQRNRSIARETNDIAKSLQSFAALPGVDQAFLQQAANVTRGEVPLNQLGDMTQAVFSASGDQQQTLGTLDIIAQASRAGMASDLGMELAIQALAQNIDPGQMVRGAFSAGAESKRDPNAIARAAPALEGFDDKMFGIAVAAKIAETRPLQVKEYTEGVAKALSGVSGASEWFAKQGLGKDATQAERLAAMNASGVDTMEKLTKIGITEDVGRKSLLSLLQNYQDLTRLESATRAGANNVELLDQRIAAGDANMPTQRLARQIREQEALATEARSFDTKAQAGDLYEITLANRLREKGMTSNAFGYPIIGEDNRLNPIASIFQGIGQGRAFLQEMAETQRQVTATLSELKRGKPAIPRPEN